MTSLRLTDAEYIGAWAFYNCKRLQRVSCPSNLTEIGAWAFASCISLTLFVVPASVTLIGGNCFKDDALLTKIIFLGDTPPTLNDNNPTFFTGGDYPLFVPLAAIETYSSTTMWSNSDILPRIKPWVNSFNDLSSIDTNVYTTACVRDDDRWITYIYSNGQWSID